MLYGDHRLAAKTSVCGTENLGSIPSDRPEKIIFKNCAVSSVGRAVGS